MPEPAPPKGRLWLVVLALSVGVAVVGFVVGTHPGDYEPRPTSTARTTPAAEAAPSYRELPEHRRGPNEALYEKAFARLHAALPGLFDPVTTSEVDRAAALAKRQERRAFDGAPPVVPHAIRQDAAPDCLVCHNQGLRLADDRVAPAMPHERRDSCTQCHVEARSSAFPEAAEEQFVANGFTGRPSPSGGDRAWSGAPPTIPHTTQMRSRCDSCHGVSGLHGLRTPHPHRESCTQCHAPGAVLDQRASAALDEGTLVARDAKGAEFLP